MLSQWQAATDKWQIIDQYTPKMKFYNGLIDFDQSISGLSLFWMKKFPEISSPILEFSRCFQS